MVKLTDELHRIRQLAQFLANLLCRGKDLLFENQYLASGRYQAGGSYRLVG